MKVLNLITAAASIYTTYAGFKLIGALRNERNCRQAAELGALKAHKFVPVYKELPGTNGKTNGKTNIRWADKKRGVYIIKENGKIIYVGYSRTNLYRTIMRHFQNWDDRRFEQEHQTPRLTYANKIKRNRYTVRIVFADDNRAKKLEHALIKKYKPRDNQDPYGSEGDLPKSDFKPVLEEYEFTDYGDPPF